MACGGSGSDPGRGSHSSAGSSSGSGGPSTGADGTATATGAFAGAPGAVASLRTAVAAIKTTPGSAGVVVEITSEADACDTVVNAGGFLNNATVLQLIVGVGPNDALPTPGTYMISPSATSGPYADAQYVSLVPTDAGCMQAAGAALNQASGTVTLTAVSPTAVSGSFDLGFYQDSIQGQPPNIDRVSGKFTAPGCILRNPSPSPLLCNGFATQ
jgi:hypothetical protein